MAFHRNSKSIPHFPTDADSLKDISPRSVLAGHFSNKGSEKSITPVVSGESNPVGHGDSQLDQHGRSSAEKKQSRRIPFGITRITTSTEIVSPSVGQTTASEKFAAEGTSQSSQYPSSSNSGVIQDKNSWKVLFSWRKNSGNLSDPLEPSGRLLKPNTACVSQHSNGSSQNVSTSSSLEITTQRRKNSFSSCEVPSMSKSGPANQERTFKRSLTIHDGKSNLSSFSGGEKKSSSKVRDSSSSNSCSMKDKNGIPMPTSKPESGTLLRWNTFSDQNKKKAVSANSLCRSKKREEKEAVKAAERLTLSLMQGDSDGRMIAVKEIRVVTKFSAAAREALGLSGAIGLLINLMTEAEWEPMNWILLSLCNLAIGNRRNKILMVEGGFLSRVVHVMKVAPSDVRESCVAVILSLASEDEHKPAIGKAGIIPYVVRVLNSGSMAGRCDAAHALYNLLGYDGNRGEILATQPIPGLLKLLLDVPENRAAEKAGAVLYTLTAAEKGRLALIDAPSAISALLSMAEKGSERGRELAISSLFTVCSQSRKFCVLANREKASVVLMKICEEENPPKLKQKVSRLVKCLDIVAASGNPSSTSSKSFNFSKAQSSDSEVSTAESSPKKGNLLRRENSLGKDSALKDLLEESMKEALSKIKSRVQLSMAMS